MQSVSHSEAMQKQMYLNVITTTRGRSLHSLCEEGWQRTVERAGAQVHYAQRHLTIAQA